MHTGSIKSDLFMLILENLPRSCYLTKYDVFIQVRNYIANDVVLLNKVHRFANVAWNYTMHTCMGLAFTSYGL